MEDLLLQVKVDADTRQGVNQAIRDLERLDSDGSRSLEDLNDRAGGVRDSIGTIATGLAGVGSAVAAGLGVAFSNLVDTSREIDNLAEVSQISTENLQAFALIAERSGGNLEDVADAAREMQLRLAEAESLGTGPAVDALNLLNIELDAIKTLAPEEQFALIRDRLSEVEEPALKAFAAEELLGGASERLAEFTGLSAEEFDNLTEAMIASGAVLNDQTITAVVDAGESVDALFSSVQGLANELLANLAPGIETVAGFLQDQIESMREADIAAAELEERQVFLNLAMDTAIQNTTDLSFGSVGLKGEYEDLEEEAAALQAQHESLNAAFGLVFTSVTNTVGAVRSLDEAYQNLYGNQDFGRFPVRPQANLPIIRAQDRAFDQVAGGSQFNSEIIRDGLNFTPSVGPDLFTPSSQGFSRFQQFDPGYNPGELYGPPQQITVEVDGETIANVVNDRINRGDIVISTAT